LSVTVKGKIESVKIKSFFSAAKEDDVLSIFHFNTFLELIVNSMYPNHSTNTNIMNYPNDYHLKVGDKLRQIKDQDYNRINIEENESFKIRY
jgi:hypothetical protein